ncbi:MAG TPA: PilZ domain-containing protein, partial [Planctomycetota bacterium]|nr:PilZ domain-containing protein [Planctomycetota bacterium]
MAPPLALINPIPVLGGISATLEIFALGLAGVALLAAGIRLSVRWRRRVAIAELARERGLGEQSSNFLGRLFSGEGLDAAETMLSAPELLRARLARELRRRHRDESAQAYAQRAAHLLEELNAIAAPFPGAPSPFLQIAVQDATDPKSEVVTAWVLSVDERNISIISRHDCEWPMRRELLVTPAAGHGESFRASLLLRPVPPRHEWVLTHDLVDVITNRRAMVRVPCCLHTHVLPANGDAILLRERLADQEPVPADQLRRLQGWAQRHTATVVDVSPDGCRLELEHEVAVRDRFHVVFIAPDDRLAGLPLAEVVALQRAAGGRVAAGVRFIGMRLKERMRLAEFVRRLAASEGGVVAQAVAALEAGETAAADVPVSSATPGASAGWQAARSAADDDHRGDQAADGDSDASETTDEERKVALGR